MCLHFCVLKYFKVLRKIFTNNGDEGLHKWRILHLEELHDLNKSSISVRVVKS
jgi:hypothetical protein